MTWATVASITYATLCEKYVNCGGPLKLRYALPRSGERNSGVGVEQLHWSKVDKDDHPVEINAMPISDGRWSTSYMAYD